MPYSNDGHDVPKYVTGGDRKRRQWSHVWNSEYGRQKGKGKSDSEAESIAFASANSVTSKIVEKRYADLLEKSAKDDAKKFADDVVKAMQKEWESLPVQIQTALENAGVSGAGNGFLQVETSSADLINSANKAAQEYAVARSAELIGMRHDDEGNLVPNPDARWAISDTTRNRIREIIAESFTEDTPLPEIKEAVAQALADEAEGNGIFSASRAAKIARTEIAMAQSASNFSVWQKSGIVRKVKWLTSNLEPCEVCLGNEDKEVAIGKPFPSGVILPPDHPNCACVLIVTEVSV